MGKMRGVGFAALGAIFGGVYLHFIRPWQQRWRATNEEMTRRMPGDDVVMHPMLHATQAVTIKARPEQIWPWLVQIGGKRAGWYSDDWMDHLGIPSAERLIPMWQHVEVGNLITISQDGKQVLWVKSLEPNRGMLWRDKQGDVTWYWGLSSQEDNHTRLIARVRIHYHWSKPSTLLRFLLDLGDLVMIRQCLRGIKQRAERASVQAPAPLAGATRHRPLRPGEPGIQSISREIKATR